MPFSTSVAKAIIKRDKRCVNCGSRTDLQAAHNDEVQLSTHPLYDKKEGGQARCVPCHIKQHQRLLEVARYYGDYQAIDKHEKSVRILMANERRKEGFAEYRKNVRSGEREGRELRAKSQFSFFRHLQGLPPKTTDD